MNETSSHSPFDVEELKHLALKAMRAGNDEDALRLLKDAVARAPENGELLYLLGMVHSNMGMVDRAIDEITRGLALTPNLLNARFQLGLLHFTGRDFEKSEAAWKPLLGMLPEHDPLRTFSIGLTQVGHNDLEGAIATLERGIALCNNESLNADMGRIVTQARRYLAESGNRDDGKPGAAASEPTTQHVLLSGYRQPDERH